jgi:hypothetical protein
LREKMVVTKGVDCPRTDDQNGDRHGMGMMTMLTGTDVVLPPGTSKEDREDTNSKAITAGAPTIDQYVLAKIKALQGTRFPSIQLAGTARSGQNRSFTCLTTISYSGPSKPLFGEARSTVAFNNILGAAMLGDGRPIDPAIVARQQAQGKSVLDFVLGDLRRLKQQVPSAQNPKLDEHIDAIRQLEQRITTAPPPRLAGCTKPTLMPEPKTGGKGATSDESAHIAVSTNMLAIIRCAFQCDVTRVASFTFADGNNGMRPKAYVPGASFSIEGEHHGDVSHGGSGADAVVGKVQTDKLYGDLTAAALLEMDKVLEGDPAGKTTMLDNTLALYFTECSIGDEHSTNDMPSLLFGGKFLNLAVGNYLTYSPSIYMNDVWTSVLNAWGQPINQYGDPKWCKGSGPQAAKGLIKG